MVKNHLVDDDLNEKYFLHQKITTDTLLTYRQGWYHASHHLAHYLQVSGSFAYKT